MVWITGTAIGFTDLWTKFRGHLLNDPGLVAANEQWTETWVSGDQAILTGPGFGGTTPVRVGISRLADPTAQRYEWAIGAVDSVTAGATDYAGHVNPSPQPRILLHDDTMPYWLAVNGHRFVLVVKVSTVYELAYGGCFLPYATPAEYPLPVFVGGCAQPGSTPSIWTDTTDGHRAFTRAFSGIPAYVRRPDGMWDGVLSDVVTGASWALWPSVGGSYVWQTVSFHDYAYSVGYGWGMREVMERMQSPFGTTEAVLTPYQIISSTSPHTGILGTLDGVVSVSAPTLTAEDQVVVGGRTYRVFPNVYRQGRAELWALEEA